VGKEGEAGNVQHCRCSLTPTTTDAAGRSQRVIGIGSKFDIARACTYKTNFSLKYFAFLAVFFEENKKLSKFSQMGILVNKSN
jgi:hypothetical protein